MGKPFWWLILWIGARTVLDLYVNVKIKGLYVLRSRRKSFDVGDSGNWGGRACGAGARDRCSRAGIILLFSRCSDFFLQLPNIFFNLNRVGFVYKDEILRSGIKMNVDSYFHKDKMLGSNIYGNFTKNERLPPRLKTKWRLKYHSSIVSTQSKWAIMKLSLH